MASELGLDVTTAHRSALMHDIGKVLWAETEAVGSHAVSGAAFAAAHGEVPEIVHPIAPIMVMRSRRLRSLTWLQPLMR